MTRTIVCGVDRSDAADAVVRVARWLAERLGSSLVLAHVVEEPMQEANDFLASFGASRGGAPEEARLLEGSPAARLMETVSGGEVDLLVVGSRGRNTIRSSILGSVSRSLATNAPCPVVIVPESAGDPDEDRSPEESIVCGVDGSEHAVAAARVAGDLAQRMECRLVVVLALPGVKDFVSYPGARLTTPSLSAQPDARIRQAEEIVEAAVAAAASETATGVVESGSPWDVLESVADRETGQLLAVAARGQGALKAALLGSVAARLAASARRPLLVLSEAAEEAIRDRSSA